MPSTKPLNLKDAFTPNLIDAVNNITGYYFIESNIRALSTVSMFPTTSGALGTVRPNLIAGRALTEDRVTCVFDDHWAVVFAGTTPVGMLNLDGKDAHFVKTGFDGKESLLLRSSQKRPLRLP